MVHSTKYLNPCKVRSLWLALPESKAATGYHDSGLVLTHGCLVIPLNVLLGASAVLFTKILTDFLQYSFSWSAVPQLFIGVGILRLKPAARTVGICYLAFGFVNAAIFYVAPGSRARMSALIESQRSMFPWMQPWQEHRSKCCTKSISRLS
jgi:hypothetical protein